MIYLMSSFKEDKSFSNNNNPPLSEEGVLDGKKFKLRNNALNFDCCYSSFLLKDFGSALIIVGDKLLVERSHNLDKLDNDKIINFVKALPSNKNILIVASNDIISVIKNNFNCMELE